MLAISASSLIILFSSTNVIFEELHPLSLKNGLTFFQKSFPEEFSIDHVNRCLMFDCSGFFKSYWF